MRTLHWLTAAFVVGVVAAVVLPGALADGSTASKLSTDKIDSAEATFGDLATDALCSAAKTTIALAPAVSFKPGEIPAGLVTKKAVSGLLHDPEEKWAVLLLTGQQIRDAFERSVSSAPTPRTYFLQVSGLTVVYAPRAPRGRKVKSIRIGVVGINEAERYEVAMPQSLADGGSGYFTIFGNAKKARSGAQGMADVITNYVDSRGRVSYTGQGRIVVSG